MASERNGSNNMQLTQEENTMKTAKQSMMEDFFIYAMHRMKKVAQEQAEETGLIPFSLSESGRCLQKAQCEYKKYMKNPERFRKK